MQASTKILLGIAAGVAGAATILKLRGRSSHEQLEHPLSGKRAKMKRNAVKAARLRKHEAEIEAHVSPGDHLR